MKAIDLIMYYGFGLATLLNWGVAIVQHRWDCAALGCVCFILARAAWLDYRDERDKEEPRYK